MWCPAQPTEILPGIGHSPPRRWNFGDQATFGPLPEAPDDQTAAVLED